MHKKPVWDGWGVPHQKMGMVWKKNPVVKVVNNVIWVGWGRPLANHKQPELSTQGRMGPCYAPMLLPRFWLYHLSGAAEIIWSVNIYAVFCRPQTEFACFNNLGEKNVCKISFCASPIAILDGESTQLHFVWEDHLSQIEIGLFLINNTLSHLNSFNTNLFSFFFFSWLHQKRQSDISIKAQRSGPNWIAFKGLLWRWQPLCVFSFNGSKTR